MPTTPLHELPYPLKLDTPAGARQIKNLAEASDRELEILAGRPTSPVLNVVDFGAVGDGVTDDTAAVASAVTAATAEGGGDVTFPAGRFKLTSVVDVPEFVNLVGAGRYATTLSLGSGAQLTFSDVTTPENGGHTGGFTLTGNGQVANPLYLGRVSNRMFSDIRVHNCTGDAIKMEGTQNCTFVSVEGAISDGAGLLLGTRTNNNAFIHCSFFDCSNSIRIADTLGTQNPRRAQFFGGLQENVRATGEACVLIEAGIDISFWGSQTSTANNGGVEPAAVKINQAVGSTVRYIRLNGMQLLSQASDGICIDIVNMLADEGDIQVENCYFRNANIGIRACDDVRMVITNPWGLSDLTSPVVRTETSAAVIETPTLQAYVP